MYHISWGISGENDIAEKHLVGRAQIWVQVQLVDLCIRCNTWLAHVEDFPWGEKLRAPLAPVHEGLNDHLVAFEDVKASSQQDADRVWVKAELQTHPLGSLEPDDLPEDVCTELGDL